MFRSRSARLAALAFAAAGPLAAVTAGPALASGERTTAALTAPTAGSASTFTWDYTFHQNGGHGLSNIAIGFCSADILGDVVSAGPNAEVFSDRDVPGGHTGFGPGIKFAVTATTGTLTVSFAHPHPISRTGLRIQSHSGDGATGDTVTVSDGPGPCPGDQSTTTTTSIATTTTSSTTTTTNSTTVTTGGGSTTTTTGGSGTTTTTGSNGSTTSTSGPSSTTTTAGGTSGGETTTTTTTTTADDDGTIVLGERLERPDEPAAAVGPGAMARTGAGHVMFLVTLGLALVGVGIALVSVFRRRRALSASSPG